DGGDRGTGARVPSDAGGGQQGQRRRLPPASSRLCARGVHRDRGLGRGSGRRRGRRPLLRPRQRARARPGPARGHRRAAERDRDGGPDGRRRLRGDRLYAGGRLMSSVKVTHRIPAPAEDVFDLLADHANYDRFRAINGSKLLREGKPAPNGVGALREIKVRPLTFEEEITAYERPTRLDYLIVKLNVPFKHH